MSAILYLIRHCETKGNRVKCFQGRIDTDISEAGAVQLEHLGRRFAEVPLTAVRTSPLLRAYRTAEAVSAPHGLTPQIDKRLIEICGGIWEGKPWADLPALDPEQSRRWVKEPWNFCAEGGEPMRSVYDRMREAILDAGEAFDGGCAALVSHGCAVRNGLCFAMGLPPEGLNEVPWCDNTAVCCLEVEHGRVCVLYANDSSHLPNPPSAAEKSSWWRG